MSNFSYIFSFVAIFIFIQTPLNCPSVSRQVNLMKSFCIKSISNSSSVFALKIYVLLIKCFTFWFYSSFIGNANDSSVHTSFISVHDQLLLDMEIINFQNNFVARNKWLHKNFHFQYKYLVDLKQKSIRGSRPFDQISKELVKTWIFKGIKRKMICHKQKSEENGMKTTSKWQSETASENSND